MPVYLDTPHVRAVSPSTRFPASASCLHRVLNCGKNKFISKDKLTFIRTSLNSKVIIRNNPGPLAHLLKLASLLLTFSVALGLTNSNMLPSSNSRSPLQHQLRRQQPLLHQLPRPPLQHLPHLRPHMPHLHPQRRVRLVSLLVDLLLTGLA